MPRNSEGEGGAEDEEEEESGHGGRGLLKEVLTVDVLSTSLVTGLGSAAFTALSPTMQVREGPT
jgi:hypothetical protein